MSERGMRIHASIAKQDLETSQEFAQAREISNREFEYAFVRAWREISKDGKIPTTKEMRHGIMRLLLLTEKKFKQRIDRLFDSSGWPPVFKMKVDRLGDLLKIPPPTTSVQTSPGKSNASRAAEIKPIHEFTREDVERWFKDEGKKKGSPPKMHEIALAMETGELPGKKHLKP